jgi:hypothetical protein
MNDKMIRKPVIIYREKIFQDLDIFKKYLSNSKEAHPEIGPDEFEDLRFISESYNFRIIYKKPSKKRIQRVIEIKEDKTKIEYLVEDLTSSDILGSRRTSQGELRMISQEELRISERLGSRRILPIHEGIPPEIS